MHLWIVIQFLDLPGWNAIAVIFKSLLYMILFSALGMPSAIQVENLNFNLANLGWHHSASLPAFLHSHHFPACSYGLCAWQGVSVLVCVHILTMNLNAETFCSKLSCPIRILDAPHLFYTSWRLNMPANSCPLHLYTTFQTPSPLLWTWSTFFFLLCSITFAFLLVMCGKTPVHSY